MFSPASRDRGQPLKLIKVLSGPITEVKSERRLRQTLRKSGRGVSKRPSIVFRALSITQMALVDPWLKAKWSGRDIDV